jgi:hypothetical protein
MGVGYIPFVLVAGFIFTQLHYPAKFTRDRSDGWVKYSRIVLFGCLFFAVALPLVLFFDTVNFGKYLFNRIGVTHRDIASWPIELAQLKLFCWVLLSCLLAVVAGLLSKFYFYHYPDKKKNLTLKLLEDDSFDHMIYDNILSNERDAKESGNWSYLQIALKSRKVYVGICLPRHSRREGEGSLLIHPVLSGYREEKEFQLIFTTNYFDHYKVACEHPVDAIANYQLVLMKNEIQSISKFKPEAYAMFQKQVVQSPRQEFRYNSKRNCPT